MLEDIGYYCVDNLPSSLLSTLYRLCLKSEDDSMKRVAVVVDVRGNEKFEEMCSQIEHFKMHYENVKVLFFDATSGLPGVAVSWGFCVATASWIIRGSVASCVVRGSAASCDIHLLCYFQPVIFVQSL